jgi:hypothetical protein
MKRAFYFVVTLSALPLACQTSDSVSPSTQSSVSPSPMDGASNDNANLLLGTPTPAPLFTQTPSSLDDFQDSKRPGDPSRERSAPSPGSSTKSIKPISWSNSEPEPASKSGGERGVEVAAGTTTRDDVAVPALNQISVAPRSLDVDGVEELFIENMDELRSVLRRVDRGETLDSFDLLRKADAEKRLISLFFLRHERNLKEFRELVDSLSQDSSGILALEILKAAFYQELGLDDLRDQALEESTKHIHGRKTTSPGNFDVVNLTFASNISGYRNIICIDPPVFRSGQETLLYGEFENFMNAEVVGNTQAERYRRSFTAHATLRDADGKVRDRHSFLTAGQFVEKENNPSHFWSNFRIPAILRPGAYTLEVLAVDLEAQVLATATLDFKVEL